MSKDPLWMCGKPPPVMKHQLDLLYIEKVVSKQAKHWAIRNPHELKKELQKRDLSTLGTKHELIHRLIQHDHGKLYDPAAPTPSNLIKKRKHGDTEIADAIVAVVPVSTKRRPKRLKRKKQEALKQEASKQVALREVAVREVALKQQASRQKVPEQQLKDADDWTRQRMFLFHRRKGDDPAEQIVEIGVSRGTFDLDDSTGIIYQCTIGRNSRCDCMDAELIKNEPGCCKHIQYFIEKFLCGIAYTFPSDMSDLIAMPQFFNSLIRNLLTKDHLKTEDPLSIPDQHQWWYPAGTRRPNSRHFACTICGDLNPFQKSANPCSFLSFWCAACGLYFHQTCFDEWQEMRSCKNYQYLTEGPRLNQLDFDGQTCPYCRREFIKGDTFRSVHLLTAPKL